MTTPGGVPNLPAGALTIDTMGATLQDMSGTAMKSRAVQRFPAIMDLSTGLSAAADLTPFGILTRIWAEVNSLVANSDPADIQGPEDIPPLLLEFIEGLPVVGQFVDLFEAILGTYTGTDTTLLGIQALFAPIRAIVDAFTAAGIDLSNAGSFLTAITAPIQAVIDAIVNGTGGGNTVANDPLAIVIGLAQQGLTVPVQIFDQLWASVAQLLSGQQALQNSPGTALIDDFLSLGVSGYTNITGTLALSSMGPYVQTPNLAVGYRTVGPSTDQHGAQIVIQGNQQGWCGAGICADTTASSYALLQVYSGFEGDAVRLLTGSAPDVAVVQAQTDFITPRLADTNTFDIWYETATNTFHVLRNGQKVFDWPDTTNIVTHDASHRKVLLFSNGEDDPTNGSYGPGIRKFTAYDKT